MHKLFLLIATIVVIAASASALGTGPPVAKKAMHASACAVDGATSNDWIVVTPSLSSMVLPGATSSALVYCTLTASPPTGTVNTASISRVLPDEPAAHATDSLNGHKPPGTFDVTDKMGLPGA